MRIEKIVNCTGVTLLIPQGAGDEHEYVEYPPAQVPARVLTEEVTVAGLDVRIVRDLGVEGLPAPEEGVFCLVTSRVALAAPDREDLLVPSDIYEWGDGRKVAGALLRPEPTPRGWGRGLPDLSAVAITLSDDRGTWATQVVAEKTRDGRSWVGYADASPAAGVPGRYTGLDQGAALAKLGEMMQVAQQQGRVFEEKLKNLLRPADLGTAPTWNGSGPSPTASAGPGWSCPPWTAATRSASSRPSACRYRQPESKPS